MAAPQTKLNRTKAAEEQALCFDLRLAGHSIRAIAEMVTAHFGYNISKSTVHNRIEAEIAERIQPRAKALREMELARLDGYLTTIAPRIAAGDLQAIDRALRIAERRAKLLGIDSPIQVEQTVTEVSAEDIELMELVNEAKARNEARLEQDQDA